MSAQQRVDIFPPQLFLQLLETACLVLGQMSPQTIRPLVGVSTDVAFNMVDFLVNIAIFRVALSPT